MIEGIQTYSNRWARVLIKSQRLLTLQLNQLEESSTEKRTLTTDNPALVHAALRARSPTYSLLNSVVYRCSQVLTPVSNTVLHRSTLLAVHYAVPQLNPFRTTPSTLLALLYVTHTHAHARTHAHAHTHTQSP
jgi:hypothetical protein